MATGLFCLKNVDVVNVFKEKLSTVESNVYEFKENMIRKIVTAAGSCITVLAVLSVSVVTNELTYDTPVSGVVQIVNLHSEQDRNTDSFKVLATKTAMLPIDSKIADDVSAGDFIEANVTSSKVIEKNEGPVDRKSVV